LSKIFDALRKAEANKSGTAARKKGPVPVRTEPKGNAESAFMRGLDENFRRGLMTLRNSIDSELKDSPHRVIMFGSAIAGEGKTTIAAFLARILALSEAEKILVVDCAVVHPEMHKLFGLDNDKGILDYLSGSASLEEVIRTVDEGVLDVVPIGPKRGADITQPLFNSEQMATFIRSVRDMYDYVLLDTSAILEAPETPIIGSYATGTVIVVQSGKTKREVIKRAMMTIEKLGGRFIGTVLNRKKYYIPEFIYRRV
jgi:capsular exopolysaccharide synthesis family protein